MENAQLLILTAFYVQFYVKLKKRNPCGTPNPNDNSLIRISKLASRIKALPTAYGFQKKRPVTLLIDPLIHLSMKGTYQSKWNLPDHPISIEKC